MPYVKVKKVDKGYKVCDPEGKCLSKKPLSLKKAQKQELAVRLSTLRKEGKIPARKKGGAVRPLTEDEKLKAEKGGIQIAKLKKQAEDFSMKKTGKTLGENLGEAVYKGAIGLAKGAYGAYSKVSDDMEAKRLAELRKKADRPLEWYETLGKKAAGVLTGATVPFGGLISKEVERATECKMRGISSADCNKIFPPEKPSLGKIAKEAFMSGLTGGSSGTMSSSYAMLPEMKCKF